MDIKLSSKGWSGSNCSIYNGFMKFMESGTAYNLNSNIDRNNDKSIVIETRTKFNGSSGIVFFHNDSFIHGNHGEMIFEMSGSTAALKVNINNGSLIIGDYKFAPLKDDGTSTESAERIKIPAINQFITLKVEIKNKNVKCYIDNTLVITTDQSYFSSGYCGLIGNTNTEYEYIDIKKDKYEDWQRIVTRDCTTVNASEKYVEIGCLTDSTEKAKVDNPELWDTIITDNIPSIKQQLTGLTSQQYLAVTCESIGNIVIIVKANGVIKVHKYFSDDISRCKKVFDFGTPFTSCEVWIGTVDAGDTAITKPMIELRNTYSYYVESSRGNSRLSFPTSKFSISGGVIMMQYKPIISAFTNQPIFYLNDRFQASHINSGLTFRYGPNILTLPSVNMVEETIYYIAFIWNQDIMEINVYDANTDQEVYGKLDLNKYEYEADPANFPLDDYDFMYVGSNALMSTNALIDNLLVANGNIKMDDVRNKMLYNMDLNGSTVISANFNKETLLYNENEINIPFFNVESPLVIKDVDNDVLFQRVTFVDMETNKSVLHGSQRFRCEKIDDSVCEIPFENLVAVWVEDEDGSYHESSFYTQLNNKTGSTFVSIQDISNYHVGKIFTVFYIIKDTYCLNYDESSNNYIINLSNVYGGQIDITIQENEGLDNMLLKTVDLNPFKSHINNGFIYLEEKPRPLSSFNVKLSPDSLVANGYDYSVITIDCLDKDGVNTNNVDVSVRMKNRYGTLEKYIEPSTQEWLDHATIYGEESAYETYGYMIDEEVSHGRYVYTLIANYYGRSDSNISDLIDYVMITDKKSGISVEIPIRLVREW